MTPGDPLSGQHVVVLGAARQGKALGRWLPSTGARVTITDLRSAEQLAADLAEFADSPVQWALGGHPLTLLDGCDVLCVSGGVPLTIPIVQEAHRRGIRVTNDAQLFLERCPAPVLAITGSAGKTTTTSLVGEMGRASGRRTWIGGNIGDVLLDVLPQIAPADVVVMELSSFQLELMTISPPVAAVLNVTPNHLDRHDTMEAYSAAKAHIYQHQRPQDIAVFGWDDPNARQMSFTAPGRVAYFALREHKQAGAYLDGKTLRATVSGSAEFQAVCERDTIRLRGDHNVLNTLAACAVAGASGIPVDAMRAAIAGFTGVEHRQETIAVVNEVTWVNDSIATAPERVVAALRSYREPLILLAGGRDKKLPWDEMAALAAARCRAVIAFGEYGPQVVEHMNRAKIRISGPRLDRVTLVDDLPQAVTLAHEIAQPGDVVLLSPGGTSYDAYLDFAERGEHFRELVSKLQP
ncbi:MAG: UDP-N-acetylmuramoyl-L-alanine--D-glutamate ligase [Chloroflexi bacterium]|nr:UDP-N-acetylmuramoyl-L-alanine--D-glutamate ligase [Chloroflexota bacterium]